MDIMFEAYLTHEAQMDTDDIPLTNGPVWILGKEYNPMNDTDKIRDDIRSKLWFTYRRGFIQIGDTGITSDKGWGCMLRCGQMVLAQALVSHHLGRQWCWDSNTTDPAYLRILHMFEDRRASPFSIHQIALMGASEGKEVGQWFGPNTVAQVLKKLAVYDEWSSVVIHVALDNTVIVNDIKRLCRSQGSYDPSDSGGNPLPLGPPTGVWKPLVLVVPLRLGLSEINPVYLNGLKTCFTFKQSLGVIGGKPNHALYFIGYVGKKVIYLDPHTTQPAGFVEDKDHEHEKLIDTSYHSQCFNSMEILEMDPSVAACFFCSSETEFDLLCKLIQEKLVAPEKQPLFELCNERPCHWVPLDDTAEEALGAVACASYLSFEDMDRLRQYDDSDEDFELLG